MTKVLCGIVMYNPKIARLIEEINSVINQLDMICLFDNGSKNIEDVQGQIFSNFSNDKIVFIKSNNNLGIGAALNKIFYYAVQNGFDWVLTLDHDSICPPNMVATYTKVDINDNVGMLCPIIVDKGMAKRYYSHIENTKKTEYITRTIQSGALVRVKCWKKVHGFDEKMFIDFVDFDFCQRLIINQYKILRVNTIELDHELGKKVPTFYAPLFKRIYEITNNRIFLYLTYKNLFSNERCFYSSRNNIIYIKKYMEYLDLKKEIIDYLDRIFRKLLRGKNRGKVLWYSIKGFVSGIKYKDV